VPLATGARLGPYEIVAPLGAGGMGEVYRAHDQRLDREVAIKVLPSEVTHHTDRLRRFEQEARAAAALNHPNVVAVFDVGIEGNVPYVVSELLDGSTLDAVIARGRLSLRRALNFGAQIAYGLSAAHHKGIVHRDLKPSNIFVTSQDRIKILDFGLAKLTAPVTEGESLTTLPVSPETMPGVVMGTVGYMAPEQVNGEPADHRADIFALGVVLYEMLAGRRAFSGASAVAIMSAILASDPPSLSPDIVPPHVDRLIHRCLEKSPAQRFQSASDVAFALEALQQSTGDSNVVPLRRPFPVRRLLAIAGAIALVVLGAVGALSLRRPPQQPLEFQPLTFDRWPVMNARFMPDGQTIVFSATPTATTPNLYLISPDAESPRELGVADAQLLAVSSRGELAVIENAFHLGQRLYKGTLARMTIGSSPRALAEDVREADWAPDGDSLAIVRDLGNGRDRLEYPEGTPLYEASGYLSDPRVSPDGTSVAFFEHQWRWDDRGWVKVVDRNKRMTTLTSELWGLQGLAWAPDGRRVLFSGNRSGGTIMQPWSARATGGEPMRSVFGVPGRFIVHDVSRDGRWLGVREDLSLGVRAKLPDADAERDLSWLGSSGARNMSADGRWLLMVDVGARSGPDYGVVLRRTDGAQTIRLGEGSAQRLSPDGKWAAAIIASPSHVVLYPTGAGTPVQLKAGPVDRFTSAEWFPSSRELLVCGSEPSRAPRCYRQDIGGSPPAPVTPEGVVASLAPDGRTLLVTRQDGQVQRTTIDGGQPMPAPGLRSGDSVIAWSGDSTSVYVQTSPDVPVRVERVDLVTTARTTARTIAPQGVAAITTLYVTDWIDDGKGFVYNYTTQPSTLFVVKGAPD
jgi:serine/threonine protein kinase/dipeptidyl aminopeptidase/acylaminoacyl peptidase